jgi:hypothetical protein
VRYSALRIKPLLMKRHCRGMSMKKNKNCDEVKHAENPYETFVSIFPLDEDEVVHPFFPPTHKYEEVISPNDAYDFMEDLFDMV